MTPRDRTTSFLEDLLIDDFVDFEAPRRPVITQAPASFYVEYVKPLIDRSGALLLLLLLLPVVAGVALAVRITLGRDVIYRQHRVGRHDQRFAMLKFRTMEADRRAQEIRVDAEADRRRQHKTDHDPRHTTLGRFLRRYSLDELPQLWNVVRGDMSLVGPRPELTSVVARYETWQHDRHRVRPGITGLWQVTERQITAGNMHLHVEIDLAYVTSISLRTDLSILLRTPLAMAKGR